MENLSSHSSLADVSFRVQKVHLTREDYLVLQESRELCQERPPSFAQSPGKENQRIRTKSEMMPVVEVNLYHEPFHTARCERRSEVTDLKRQLKRQVQLNAKLVKKKRGRAKGV